MGDMGSKVALERVASAMRNAVIRDDEGEFPRLFDLLDFSGENKAHTVTYGLARAAIEAMAHNHRFKIGDPVHVIVKREGQPRFPGYIIGSYIPLDGRHQGWVVEHERDGIVHVYSEAQLAPGLGDSHE